VTYGQRVAAGVGRTRKGVLGNLMKPMTMTLKLILRISRIAVARTMRILDMRKKVHNWDILVFLIL
jgi:hypothetical protein